jgi:hypothetical protein
MTYSGKAQTGSRGRNSSSCRRPISPHAIGRLSTRSTAASHTRRSLEGLPAVAPIGSAWLPSRSIKVFPHQCSASEDKCVWTVSGLAKAPSVGTSSRGLFAHQRPRQPAPAASWPLRDLGLDAEASTAGGGPRVVGDGRDHRAGASQVAVSLGKFGAVTRWLRGSRRLRPWGGVSALKQTAVEPWGAGVAGPGS